MASDTEMGSEDQIGSNPCSSSCQGLGVGLKTPTCLPRNSITNPSHLLQSHYNNSVTVQKELELLTFFRGRERMCSN
ncbi:hypothetical protein TNCV_3594081 [Trichonephila clavipes]|nr:hypothetical protein TNCV_3594081 [Trichonephila clavipes]